MKRFLIALSLFTDINTSKVGGMRFSVHSFRLIFRPPTLSTSSHIMIDSVASTYCTAFQNKISLKKNMNILFLGISFSTMIQSECFL